MGDEAILLANYIGGVVQGDAIEFMRRSRTGVSSSMNGALEYTGLKVAEKALAWFAPIRADMEARAAAAERERDALRQTVIAFAGPHAANYAKDFGLPVGHLHPTHYDILERCGARMDEFTRADLDTQPR